MNELNEMILNKLTIAEYREFIRNMLGLSEFLTGGKKKISAVGASKGKKGRIAIAVLPEEKKNVEFYVGEDDWRNKTYQDDSKKVYSISEIPNISEDYLFTLLMTSRKSFANGIDISDIPPKSNECIRKDEKGELGFILGAGINIGLGPKPWQGLINDIEQVISASNLITQQGMQELSNASNINYLMPQVAKDISEKGYFDAIWNSNYSSVNWSNLNATVNSGFVDQNLYQVARILSAQRKRGTMQKVLTFNYDNLLETVLDSNFGMTSFSEYAGQKMPKKDGSDVKIVHSHGYLPYSPEKNMLTKKQKNSIVFSSFEYMGKYLNRNSYSYQRLEEQLEFTNLILGNSVADYEEQKVFYSFHRRNLNKFSYMITVTSGDKWVDYYKSFFLFRLGVIVMYFQDWKSVNDYLKTLN